VESCFDYYEVWAISMDPDRPGLGVDMVALPNHESCVPPAEIADAGPYRNARPGETVHLAGSGQTQAGPVNYCWVAPTGIVLDDPASATPSFVAPDTTMDRELLFTLFVDDGANVSAPDRTVVRLLPEPDGAEAIALAGLAALAARARRR
jgi:MYXO-CTERM domain-containing protein